nr:putative ribonuclease H-like domain-containing protein [Tanacetum cinerariifolium]
DPKEESSAKTSDETKSKDKGKGILVEDPKPIKKKQQVEMDEAYVRKLHEELNQDIDWDVAIEHVKQKAKEDPFIQRYQVLDYFKGKSYDDIRLIFEAKFNTNMEFLLKSKEQIEEEESRALESINETSTQKAAKRRRLNQKDKDVKEIKKHLEIMPDEDDDVYTEATPLARKAMFGRPDGQDNVWKSQRSVHGQAMDLTVAQGHIQEEDIDYDEVFTPVARIEAIRLFLAYASFKNFVVYQMDVKSAFLYEKIKEEVYVCQPSGFEDPDFPDKVYKVETALYGLHQALRACKKDL